MALPPRRLIATSSSSAQDTETAVARRAIGVERNTAQLTNSVPVSFMCKANGELGLPPVARCVAQFSVKHRINVNTTTALRTPCVDRRAVKVKTLSAIATGLA
ncbi:hypothetical protein [Xanthomonas campestris]|uniref:hypothetical protein n=1 Tax=Xanthomonas campestris TaxID=339 RepID=UPI0008A3CC72|nr:hypothetical protein [Xanthomonas campestris]RFF57079.1 hypothetical protein D0A41_06625 [Xanthomonas campestris]RFF60313.1 hypothetical protein D0A36_04955 [Xanthomonas campestris]WDJ00063.1 hypothetical protein JH295_15685 [Xanthomonas campestris pv. incanae]